MLQEIDMATYIPKTKTILAIGESGAGKTRLCGTAKKPVMLFSFDKGYDTVALTPGVKVVSILEEDRRRPVAWREFKMRFDKWLLGEEYTWPDGRKEQYRTGALDSLTFLSQYCLNHFQGVNNNIDKKATYTEYQQILDNMEDILGKIKRTTEYMVCTALLRTDKDELTGQVMMQPNVIGSLRDKLAAHFDAVFLLAAIPQLQGQPKYIMKTAPDMRVNSKFRLPAAIKDVTKPSEEPNIDKLLTRIENRAQEQSTNGQLEGSKQQVTTPAKESTTVGQRPVARPMPKPVPRPAVVQKKQV